MLKQRENGRIENKDEETGREKGRIEILERWRNKEREEG
jgi:ribosomal protein S14